MKLFLEILTWVTFAVAMVVSPVAWFRMMRAKTRSAYWKNIALFVVPILMVFLFADYSGLTPKALKPPPVSLNFQDVFGRMPTAQRIAVIAMAVLWIGGGNLLFYLHSRRLGKRWWQVMNPLDPPFKDFDAREWLILLFLAVASLGIGASAIFSGPQL